MIKKVIEIYIVYGYQEPLLKMLQVFEEFCLRRFS